MCFPCGSAGKESTCNVGDLGSIPSLGRSPGEGTAYPLQYSWASLVAQLVKNPPAMQETPVRFLDCEDPLEKEQPTHSSILGLPWSLSWERICPQCGRPGFDPWVGEDSLEKGKSTHSSLLVWRVPWIVQSNGLTETQLSNFHFTMSSVEEEVNRFAPEKKTSSYACEDAP